MSTAKAKSFAATRYPIRSRESRHLPGGQPQEPGEYQRGCILILETLLHVKAVGNDLKFNSRRCGKAGQLVPVSDGSPHLLVAEA